MKPTLPDGYPDYDPARPTECQQEAERHLARLDRDAPFTVRTFPIFSMVVAKGFRRVSYESWYLESGHLFWITDEHARAIGRTLRPGMRYFGLVMTTLKGRGFHLMTQSLRPGVQIDEVLVKHTSGDEVTCDEADGLARLITALGCRTFHLWAGEYDPGALERLCDTLHELDNTSLQEVDICDTSLPEPEDRLPLPALEPLLRRNRG